MTRTHLSAACLSPLLALAACSPAIHSTRADRTADHVARAAEPHQTTAADEAVADAAEADMPARKPGDFVVYRFSGTFRKQPIVLTERVIAREGTFMVLDVTFAEGKTKQQFRVRMNDAPGARGEVASVARIDNGHEKPASLGLFEALMARTALVADQNEAVVGTEPVTVEIGSAQLPCTSTSYRVKIGTKQATMRTIASATFPWGDVGNEIKAADGTILYRAEVMEAGTTPQHSAAPVASSDDE